MSIYSLFSRGRLPIVVLIVGVLSGCSVQKQTVPGLTGPSELGLGLEISAAPEVLPRDGASVSTITVKAFDPNGKPKAGQRLMIEASAGVLPLTEGQTGTNGIATFQYIAPGINDSVSSVTISVTPLTNSSTGDQNSRSVRLEVNGPPVPVPSFNFSPAAPAQNQLVTFDATTSALNFQQCSTACTYAWSLGDGNTATGQIYPHRYTSQGTKSVTLTVTSLAYGTYRSITRSLTVGPPTGPTATFGFSPTNPKVNDTIFFDASGSQGANGATISTYTWDFGNGQTFVSTTSSQAQTSYGTDRAWRVRLTVTDSNSQTATFEQTVTVRP
jgi:PKD repeat protein